MSTRAMPPKGNGASVSSTCVWPPSPLLPVSLHAAIARTAAAAKIRPNFMACSMGEVLSLQRVRGPASDAKLHDETLARIGTCVHARHFITNMDDDARQARRNGDDVARGRRAPVLDAQAVRSDQQLGGVALAHHCGGHAPRRPG